MNDHRRQIEELLTRRIGLDPVSLGPRLIHRATERRMAELGIADPAAYAARVAESESEQQALIEEVIVPESWFFRDERPFRWLAEHVREQWIGAPWRAPLRALSLPCAAGQEPYSIAITLREAGLSARRFHIDAVDVSARLLEIARRGVYSANAFRGRVQGSGVRGRESGDGGSPSEGPTAPRSPSSSSSSLIPNPYPLPQFFRPHAPTGYEVEPSIRATVRFLQANVLDPSLLADAAPYDVVFCRNLLIYLDPRARAGLIATLDRLLAADGVLFIGHADRLEVPAAESRFVAVVEPGCFAYRRAAGPSDRPAVPDWPPSLSSAPAPAPASAPALPMPTPALMLPEPSSFASLPGPTSERATDVSLASAGAVPPRPASAMPSLLDQAAELANRGRHAEAIAACEQHLRQKGPGASAYYLMGMISQSAGDRRRAEECFHKTIYLDPRHADALLALALLAERRGDHEAAQGFRRRARRQADAETSGDRGTTGRTPAQGGER